MYALLTRALTGVTTGLAGSIHSELKLLLFLSSKAVINPVRRLVVKQGYSTYSQIALTLQHSVAM